MNPVEYLKYNYFDKINQKIAIISDLELETKKDFFKIDVHEPVWSILNLSWKYDFVFVVLDKLNYDNIYRLYKYDIKNICVLNLNAWYTWMWKKLILPDLEDIYIKEHIKIYEIMDIASLDFYINNFFNSKEFTHIRIPNKELENKIWSKDIYIKYENIINFSQYWFSWYDWIILSYGSMLQESINVAWLLKEDNLNMDFFRIWNFKTIFSLELINSLKEHNKNFIIWDFSNIAYKDFIYSKFYDTWIVDKKIVFITPENIKPTIEEFLSEQVGMSSSKIYERIKKYYFK